MTSELLGGHCGKSRMYSKLCTHYYWKGMSKDVARMVKECPTCQLTKTTTHTKEKLTSTKTPQKPFDIIIMDTIGPLSKSNNGNKYAVTLMCDLTKHVTNLPIPNKEAKTVAKAVFENFILTFGIVKNIRTDLGTEYKNQVFKEMSQLLEYDHDYSTAYHHQTVGTIERNHRVLNSYLRAYILDSRDDWDQYAKYFEFCYNTTPNTALNLNCSPFELVFGRECNLPIHKFNTIEPTYYIDNYVQELKYRLQKTNEIAHDILTKYKSKMKTKYDKNFKELNVKVGDGVKVRNDAGEKLEPVYKGPFEVIEVLENNIKIKDEHEKESIVHKNRALLYH